MIKGIIDIIKENIQYFPIVRRFSLLSIKKLNKGSDMGFLWLFLKPLMYVAMFYVAIAFGFRSAKDIDGSEVPYIIWLASGIFAWFFMQTYAVGNSKCFLKYKNYFKEGAMPISIIPTISIMTGLYVHAMLVGLLFILAMIAGVKPDIHWIQIPVYTFAMACFAYVWTMLTGLITALTEDFINIINSIKPAFFWLSGIFFNSRAGGKNQYLFYYNPISFPVEGYRNAIAYKIWFWEEPERIKCFLISMFILTTLAVLLYRRVRRQLPEFV